MPYIFTQDALIFTKEEDMKIDPATAQKIDAIFTDNDKTITPGCSLAVVKDGEIIYKRGYGMANLEYGVPNTPSTIFHIASISKHFAAAATCLLAQDGKLALDDEIHKYLPEMADFGVPITIRQLMYHISGIRDQWSLLILAGWRMDDVITMDDIKEMLTLQRELNFQPGEEWYYSNSGYTMLAFIVQKVSGKSLREFCEERIFKPLGMKSTHFHDDHTMIVKGRSYSYAPAGPNLFSNAVLSYANAGATSLFTTVEDMALWDEEFYTGKVLGKDIISWMQVEGKLNNGEGTGYGLGLQLAKYRGLRTVGHGGADAGYRSEMIRFPEQHFSVIILGNFALLSPSMLAKKVADICLGDAFPEKLEEEGNPIKLEEEELKEKAGMYYNEHESQTMELAFKQGMLVSMMGPGIPLEPLSKERFRVVPFPFIKVILRKQEDGTPLMEMDMGLGKPSVYKKVIPSKLNLTQLKAFAGKYYCPELDTFYTFLVKDKQLHLSRRKYGVKSLKPTITDGFAFVEEGPDLQFTRNEKGKVNGFRVFAGRVRNLKFKKIG
jgi:CubicO group peptidase (beta-lactamase class C family)